MSQGRVILSPPFLVDRELPEYADLAKNRLRPTREGSRR